VKTSTIYSKSIIRLCEYPYEWNQSYVLQFFPSHTLLFSTLYAWNFCNFKVNLVQKKFFKSYWLFFKMWLKYMKKRVRSWGKAWYWTPEQQNRGSLFREIVRRYDMGKKPRIIRGFFVGIEWLKASEPWQVHRLEKWVGRFWS